MSRMRIGAMELLLVAGFAARVCGGNLNPTAATNSLGSAMYTLENIYQYMATGKTGAVLSAFSEPSAGPTNTMHTLNDIMGVATQRAFVARTGVTKVYRTGDDGTYRSGLFWPNPRFTTNNIAAAGTNVVTDLLTGLMWTRNIDFAAGKLIWSNAVVFCTNMNAGAGTYGSAIGGCRTSRRRTRSLPGSLPTHPFRTRRGLTSAQRVIHFSTMRRWAIPTSGQAICFRIGPI